VPIDRDKIIQAAQKFVEKKRYDKAVLEYQRIVQEDPNDARTLLKIGDLQLKMEAYADAIATYERVGRHYAAQGFSLKAIAVYKQIREILHKHVPQLEERYGHIAPKLAELYQQLGLVSDALAALEELAVRHQRAGRDQDAIAMFHKIVELDPSNPLPHLRLAEALSRTKDIDGAAAEFGIAAAQLVKHNRRDDALKVLERLMHHKQDPVQARLAAELYLARNGANDGMQALAKLQVCFQANPKDLDTLALLARAFAAIGQASKGLEVHKEMARIARDQGKVDTFREIVAKLQTMAPNDDVVRQLATQAAQATTGNSIPVSTSTSSIPAARVREPSAAPEEEIAEVDAEELISYQSYAPPAMADDGPDAAPEMMVGDTVEGSALDEETAARAAEVAMIVEEANQHRARRQHSKAIERLRSAVDLDPQLVDVRITLRDVLLEAGRTEEAIEEMLVTASLQLDSLDGEGAARTLEEVLAIDPMNERAVNTLRELGYDVELPADAPAESGAIASDEYDPGPLPAYDLDDPSEQHEAIRPSRTSAIPAAEAPKPWETIDSPFGESSPLPSFGLDDADPLEDSAPAAAESDAAFELVRGSGSSPPAEIPPQPESSTQVEAAAPVMSPSLRAGAADLEEALEEADFFTSRGLFDDARAVLTEQLARAPNHPLLVERMAELDAQEQTSQQSSGTRQMPLGGGEDRSFDIAASLDALESLEAPSTRETAESQVDVEEVFAKFKEGVEKIISVDDAQSHYDLGVAYKEMDRLDDSIRELAVAARDPKRACICESMIGQIWMDRGDVNKAVDAFTRGLAAQTKTPEQETSLAFDLGNALEQRKSYKEALAAYQRVARREPTYRDVEERIRRLQRMGPQKPSIRAAAVGADNDDFDRAFDEIIGPGKKLP
jgi:tetratricopeptide (TPR) repeat protein